MAKKKTTRLNFAFDARRLPADGNGVTDFVNLLSVLDEPIWVAVYGELPGHKIKAEGTGIKFMQGEPSADDDFGGAKLDAIIDLSRTDDVGALAYVFEDLPIISTDRVEGLRDAQELADAVKAFIKEAGAVHLPADGE